MSQIRVQPWKPLFPVKVPGCRVLVNYTNDNSPFRRQTEAAEYADHGSHAKIEDLLANTPRGILRWKIVTDSSARLLSKGILRSYLRNRWKHGFKQALRDKGYTVEGRHRLTGRSGVSGTLELAIVNAEGFKSPIGDMVSQCRSVIEFLEGRKAQRLTAQRAYNARVASTPQTGRVLT